MSSSLPDFMRDEKPVEIPQGKLGELGKLANLLVKKNAQIEQAEEELKRLKKEHVQIEQEAIPSLMNELGLTEVTTEDGSVIAIKTAIYGSITKANEPAAFSWLEENGFGDLIKVTVNAKFGRGEKDVADQTVQMLEDHGADVTAKQAVHPSTLRAFVREQLEKGADLPLNILGAIPVTKATVTQKRK